MRIVLQQSGRGTDHFLGVPAALAARGVGFERFDAGPVPPMTLRGAAAVVVSDVLAPASLHLLRQARAEHIPSVLLMDGILDWRNSCVNRRVGPRFLRPAPVDIIACSGELDAELLALWGNRAVATGLPRLAALRNARGNVETPETTGSSAPSEPAFPQARLRPPLPRHTTTSQENTTRRVVPPSHGSPMRPADVPQRRVLIATARHPFFDEIERDALISALRRLQAVLREMNITPIWRLTAGLDHDLDVKCDSADLATCLRDCDAVLTTPSTLMVEAMLAGHPTAVIHPFASPLWPPLAWVWRDQAPPPPQDDPLADATRAAAARADHVRDGVPTHFDRRDLPAMLTQLLAPDEAHRQVQRRALNLLCAEGDAAAALADLLIETANRGPTPSPRPLVELPTVARRPAPLLPRPDRRRVVSCVICDGSPVGGVTTWSIRLGHALRRCKSAYDFHTLLIATHPRSAFDPGVCAGDDPLRHLCVLDPTIDAADALSHVRSSIEALQPEITLPNYGDLAYAAAMQLQRRGRRCVAVAHADSAYYRRIISYYNGWDGAVAVSDACRTWLAPIASDRPMAKIVYGVPVAWRPRTVPRTGPLRLAYIGRMVEEQKRIGDLLELVSQLVRRNVSYELHLVGDGFDMEGWIRKLRERHPDQGAVVLHGRKPHEWVETFLERVDVSVLVSEYEGASISMLEAMGAGVVPCVTAVASGVGEFVRDGENGIVTPIGAMDEMACRLAELAANRDRVRALGRAAWETVRATVGLESMAKRYETLFDRVRAAPRREAGPDLGMRLFDEWRWTKHWSDAPAEADTKIEAMLRDAGCKRIAFDRPAAGADAVLIRSAAEAPRMETIEAWRRGGLAVAVSPTLLISAAQDRAGSVLRELAESGARPVAVYGVGRHTLRLLRLFHDGAPIVGFIDDAAAPGQCFLGWPVVRLEEVEEMLRPDAILLSSDAFEEEMWDRTAGLRAKGVRVVRLYARSADESSVPADAPAARG